MTQTPEVWIVYRDVTGFPRKKFERLPTPGPDTLVVRNQTLPGRGEFPTMYVRNHRIEVGGQVVRLITYTESAVTPGQAVTLAREGLQATQPPEPAEPQNRS